MTNVTYVRKPVPRRIERKKVRACLKCRGPFESEWSGERVCKKCKTRISWRMDVSGLPVRWIF